MSNSQFSFLRTSTLYTNWKIIDKSIENLIPTYFDQN